MGVKLPTEHHLESLSLKGCFTGSSETTFFKIPHCWESHVTDHFNLLFTILSGTCSSILSITAKENCLMNTTVFIYYSNELFCFFFLINGVLMDTIIYEILMDQSDFAFDAWVSIRIILPASPPIASLS